MVFSYTKVQDAETNTAKAAKIARIMPVIIFHWPSPRWSWQQTILVRSYTKTTSCFINNRSELFTVFLDMKHVISTSLSCACQWRQKVALTRHYRHRRTAQNRYHLSIRTTNTQGHSAPRFKRPALPQSQSADLRQMVAHCRLNQRLKYLVKYSQHDLQFVMLAMCWRNTDNVRQDDIP